MRRILLASVLALAPAVAFAQGADDNANPPLPPSGIGGPGAGWSHQGKRHHWMSPEQILMAFYAANTSHDGHLTLAQAKAANFKPVVEHFSEIDANKKGYVTFYDIQAWRLDEFAKHLEKRADELRAKDQ
ncbi:hypothetical protein SAMN02746095_00375 [Acidocella aminolytica 101 = DSM 11237]|jgi:hypothetical protein|uniref:EF-hand domain-containing protein n=2 Tax=Acidocella TaxID=50709 RepID=A0A0D6PEU1_9PROT|nr:EF-hand domain-containing protein [Acidocella aminolytica]GAN79379.1 hypothetical protein Aam_020_143 [Acidocella aminolytica 101 = DSM 11237]GBQ39356.1 hypothetical protein AA11237_2041 [Acidocella aminolytica 101 = DSM 11237]SHE39756.1 hypothetical protein SAMN02746095_00375 [Acidocella aminolytica 101 = DSM 11237]